MGGLVHFFNGFFQRKGSYIFMATLIARIASLLASYIAIQFIGNVELGYVIYALNIMAFILPISGLGVQQGLLRFGARLTSVSEKRVLFSHVFKKGLLFSFLLSLIVFLSSYLLSSSLPQAGYFLRLLSVLLFTSFLFEIVKIQFRLEHNNKQFAYAEIVYNVILVLNVFILGYYFKELGYAIAILVSPLLAFLLFFKSLKISFKTEESPVKLDVDFMKFGIFTGLANVATQLLFAIDIILIGVILKDAALVTAYKYVSIIPFSLLFLPNIILTTDFVTLTERIYDKDYIKDYGKTYMLLFLLFSVGIALLFYFFSDLMLGLFDSAYPKHRLMFFVLTAGIFGILIFRGLYGNLLSALGRSQVNYWISFSALLINIPANYYLIPKYGILGAAITSASLMWLSSIASFIAFKTLHNKVSK